MKTRQLCVRLRSLGVPKQQADELIALFCRWVECSGPEWTVERMKALKLEYVTRLSGKPVLAPNIKRNRDGYPFGVLSWLMKRTQSPRKVFQALNSFMIYSSLRSSQITVKQKEKFFGSMESKDRTGLDSTMKIVPTYPGRYKLHRQRPFLLHCTSPSKSAPSCLGPSIRNDDAWGQLVTFSQSIPSTVALDLYPRVFEGVIPMTLTRKLIGTVTDHLFIPQRLECVQSVGKISFIQEPGYKLRAVANPNAVWQAALDPLKNLILSDLKSNFPTDCTHNQFEGVLAICGWLKQGKTCYSVDLSDATNTMPRNLQMDALRRRYDPDNKDQYLQDLISAFNFASKSEWYYRAEDGSYRTASFTRGQPLGLGPSFASFALAHNLILQGLCEKVGVRPLDTFRVLGDDVVICDTNVNRLYRATLKNYGCTVSESKTITSDQVAEFAGMVITPKGPIPTYKWRTVVGSNFLQISKIIGPRARNLLTKQQRWIVDALAPVPESLGGFGWNPAGVPLRDRLATPVAQWLLSRTIELSPDRVMTLVQYKTLSSLYTNMLNEGIKSGYIPQHDYETFEQRLHAGMPLSSRESVLTYWPHPMIAKSMECSSHQARKGVFLNTFLLPCRDDSPFIHLEDDEFGTLVPTGIFRDGDPRANVSMLSLFAEIMQSKFKTHDASMRVVNKLLGQESVKPRPSLREVDRRECVGKSVEDVRPTKGMRR